MLHEYFDIHCTFVLSLYNMGNRLYFLVPRDFTSCEQVGNRYRMGPINLARSACKIETFGPRALGWKVYTSNLCEIRQ